jgi:predicted GIY-YIG superfamily endonuclease
METYIYVIAADEHGPVKIGYSNDPNRRLKELQTGYPKPLALWHQQEFHQKQAKLMEQLIHKTLRHRCSYGEWFKLSVQQAIAEVEFHLIRYGDEPNLRNYL